MAATGAPKLSSLLLVGLLLCTVCMAYKSGQEWQVVGISDCIAMLRAEGGGQERSDGIVLRCVQHH